MNGDLEGPSLPGRLGAILVLAVVLAVSGCALRAIWAGGPHAVRAGFGP